MLLVLHGADEFSAREALHDLLSDPRFAYNIDRFDGPLGELGAIRQACGTLPFLGDGRLVVVDGLPKAKRGEAAKERAPDAAETPAPTGKGQKSAKKPSAAAQAADFAKSLAALATDIPPTTTLAVIVTEELPKTHPLVEAAQAHGTLRTFAPPTGAALERWIVARAKQEHAIIAPDAARELASLANGSLRRLANEIAKVATYVGRDGTIDLATVQRLVPDSRETRAFDLTDALGRGDRATALRILHELLADGQAPLMIVGMVTGQIRRLAQVQDLVARGKRPAEIAAATGMAPYAAEKTVAQAKRFTAAQIDAAQRACLEVDTALKRSRMAPDLALDLLLAEFGRG